MANTIQIKHGTTVPEKEDLNANELGFNSATNELYIGKDGENVAPVKIGASLPLSIENGGTGNSNGIAVSSLSCSGEAATAVQWTNPQNIKVNLGAEWDCYIQGGIADTANNPLQLGVMNILPISHGGTGGTTNTWAAANLLCHPTDEPTEDTPTGWSTYGPSIVWHTGTGTSTIAGPKDGYYGHIINIPYSVNSQEFCQIFLTAPTGEMYVRGANWVGWKGSTEGSNQWQNIALQSYPVGSIYLSVYGPSAFSPGSEFGGSWELIQDVFLLGTDWNNTVAVGSTGGEWTHTLTTSEMPSHSHGAGSGQHFIKHFDNAQTWYGTQGWETGYYCYYNDYTGSTGSSGAHNNMPPYLAVAIWYRYA